MTVVAEPKVFTFGSDESVECVLSELIAQEDASSRSGIVLFGVTTDRDAHAARAALREAVQPGAGLYPRGQSYFLDAEFAGLLFESLADFALGETSCEPDEADLHYGYRCDCDLRSAAWSWASDIAQNVAGVELV